MAILIQKRHFKSGLWGGCRFSINIRLTVLRNSTHTPPSLKERPFITYLDYLRLNASIINAGGIHVGLNLYIYWGFVYFYNGQARTSTTANKNIIR